jgi:cob(I)alamin adenosyltransferase
MAETTQGQPSSQTRRLGLVEVFTGGGRGKTTAALGVAMRALGQGLKVHVIFFMKGYYPYGEQKTLAKLPNVSFERFGQLEFVDPAHIREEERLQGQQALLAAYRAVLSGEYDLVILDEVNLAATWGLVDIEGLIRLIRERPTHVELILTGRSADPRLIELADLVTEMVEVKHPYCKGILSRCGIDY